MEVLAVIDREALPSRRLIPRLCDAAPATPRLDAPGVRQQIGDLARGEGGLHRPIRHGRIETGGHIRRILFKCFLPASAEKPLRRWSG